MEGNSKSSRRSTRLQSSSSKPSEPVPVEPQTSPAQPTKAGSKRKRNESDGKASLQPEYLLKNPKSKLTTMDISELLNYAYFSQLSVESQEYLCFLLPPTFFVTFQPTVDPTHPSRTNSNENDMVIDSPIAGPSAAILQERSPETFDPASFTSSFFLSASKTFQDHLYSSWFTEQSQANTTRVKEGLQEGTFHAEWKDAAWEREYLQDSGTNGPPENDLSTLVKRSLLRKGDVLAYKRHFATPGVTVEKDLLVTSINPTSYAVTLLLQPLAKRALPPNLLTVHPSEPLPPIRTMEYVMSSEEVEDGVLDVDGRVSRADRHSTIQQLVAAATPNGNGDAIDLAQTLRSVRAAKALTVYRWRDNDTEEKYLLVQERGGREPMGTVYYLRNF